IALHDGHRRDGLGHHTASGDDGTVSDGDVGKNDRTGSYKSILLNFHALRFAEMGDYRDAHAKRCAVFNGDEVRARGIQDDVIADPNIFSNVYAAQAMQHYAQASRAGRNPSQVLEDWGANAFPPGLL